MDSNNNSTFERSISNCILTLEQNETKSATVTKILFEIEDLVLRNFNEESKNPNFNIEVFKNTWCRRINESRKALKISNKNATISNKAWNAILNKASTAAPSISTSASTAAPPVTTPSASISRKSSSATKSSTSSLSYQQLLKSNDFLIFKKSYNNIKSKWQLKSGRYVEDLMYNKVKEFKVEHPAHSFILNIEDEMWVDVFSEAEIEEIKETSKYNEFYDDLPINIFNMMSKLDNKKTFREIYDMYKDLKVDRYEEPELFWVRQGILDYIDLFYNCSKIDVGTEQDLLDEVYGFVKKSRKISNLSTSNASGSTAFSEAKNKRRKISGTEALTRQKNPDCFDLVFKRLSTEIGCVEIGLDDEGPNGTKFLQEKEFKTPRMMKAFSLRMIDQYPAVNIDRITIVGVVISGFYITCLKMTLVGSVSLLLCSERLKMPESIGEVPSLLPPALALVYNSAQIMKRTEAYLEDISSTFSFKRPEAKSSLPPCFFVGENN